MLGNEEIVTDIYVAEMSMLNGCVELQGKIQIEMRAGKQKFMGSSNRGKSQGI